jgi:hypothetical protein
VAITRKMEARTLKLKGSIKKKNITILVNSRSTHYFVDINLAKQLKLFVYPMKDLIVKVIDGPQIKGIGRCQNVSVRIKSLELQTGCYALPLSGDGHGVMVLEAEWLMRLYT